MPNPDKNILIIDADQRSRRLAVSAVEEFAARVIQSTSLREADLELPFCKPDLIIMEAEFGDGKALDWLGKKRADGVFPAVFIVSSECHSTEEFCKLKTDLGVQVFLHKPVSVATLQQFVEKHFNGPLATKDSAGAVDLDEIEREIKALSLDYIRELPERFLLLKRWVADLKLGKGEAASAKNEAHKIKGTASSYGAHAIGEQAVIIDESLKRVIEKPNSYDDWIKLEAALDEALRLSEAAVDEANSHIAAPAVYDEKSALSSIGLPTGVGQSIVIVDDDPDFTKRISLVLGYEDMLVYSFNDARRISLVLEEVQPDLLILDLNMPDMDGFEVCKRIRLDSRWKNLPIVFLTAQTGWETRVAAFDSGADDYIPKPVVNQELIARIRVRAEKSRLQDQLSSQSNVNKLLWQTIYTMLLQNHAMTRSS